MQQWTILHCTTSDKLVISSSPNVPNDLSLSCMQIFWLSDDAVWGFEAVGEKSLTFSETMEGKYKPHLSHRKIGTTPVWIFFQQAVLGYPKENDWQIWMKEQQEISPANLLKRGSSSWLHSPVKSQLLPTV